MWEWGNSEQPNTKMYTFLSVYVGLRTCIWTWGLTTKPKEKLFALSSLAVTSHISAFVCLGFSSVDIPDHVVLFGQKRQDFSTHIHSRLCGKPDWKPGAGKVNTRCNSRLLSLLREKPVS